MRPFRRLARGLRLSARVARLLLPHAAGLRGAFLLAAALSLLVLAFRLAQAWPLKWIVDDLSGASVPWGLTLPLLCAAYILVGAAAALSEYGQRIVVSGLGSRTVHRFRGHLFSHLLRLPLTFHERRGAGELLTRVVYDTSRLRRGVVGVLLRMYQSVLFFLATVAVLVWIEPMLAGIVLACGLIAFWAMLAGNRRILAAARRSRRNEGRLASLVEEDLRGIRELQTFGAGDRRFDDLNQASLKGEQKVFRLEAALLFRVETLIAAAICLILWQGTEAVAAARMTAGDLILFASYALALYRPFTQFARQASQAGRTVACAERLMKLTERETSLPDGTLTAPALAGDIALKNVCVKARRRRAPRKWILDELSFHVSPGERVAVMGPNGAGKSTLLRLIARLQDPQSGRLLLDDRDAREYTLASLRGQISAAYQEAILFGLTVRENLALGRPDATDEEVARALERSGAAHLVKKLRRKLDAPVRAGRLFSGGERQRLAVARALLRDGQIWLLDEPLNGVDSPADLERELLEATRGRTTFWITHDLATARKMDRVLLLFDGRVKFFGPPAEFQAMLTAGVEEEYLTGLREEA